MLKVKDHVNLVRDPVSKAIINLDTVGLESYQKRVEQIRKRNDQISENTEDIKELKRDMSDIKEMLTILLNSQKG